MKTQLSLLLLFMLSTSQNVLAEDVFRHCVPSEVQVILVGENHSSGLISKVWDPSGEGRNYVFSHALQGHFPFLTEVVPGVGGAGDRSLEVDIVQLGLKMEIPADAIKLDKVRGLESEGYALAMILDPMPASLNYLEEIIRSHVILYKRTELSTRLEYTRRFSLAAEVYLAFLKEIEEKYPRPEHSAFRNRVDQLSTELFSQWKQSYSSSFATQDLALLKKIGFSSNELDFINYRLYQNAVDLANAKYPSLHLTSSYENKNQAAKELHDKIILNMRNLSFAKKISQASCHEFKGEPYIVVYMGYAHLEGVRKNLEALGINRIESFNLYKNEFKSLQEKINKLMKSTEASSSTL